MEQVKEKRVGMARHYTSYAIGNILSLLTGFVSFPIMNRVLSNHDIGLIAYIDAVILFLVAIFKFGIGDALLRFYPYGQGRPGLNRLVASAVVVPLAGSTAMICVLGFVLGMAVWQEWIDYGTAAFLALAGVPLSIFTSYAQWIAMAQERSSLNAVINTSSKWLQSLLVISALLLVAATPVSVFSARLIAALVIVCWLAWWLFRQTRPTRQDVDTALTRSVLVYSVPLAINEMASVALAMVDRVVLMAMVGSLEVVGIYAIGSSLAMYVSMLIGTTLSQAYTPVANRLYVEQGSAAVVAFKRSMLMPMTYAVALIAAGLVVFGPDLFILAAGKSKVASTPIFVVMSLGFCLSTLLNMAAYGAILEKKTRALLAANLIAMTVKVAGNLVLIPVAGLMGTVYSTLISLAVLAACLYRVCPPDLRTMLAPGDVARSVLFAGTAAGAGWLLFSQAWLGATPLLRLLVGAPLVTLLYVALLLTFNRHWRELLQGWLRRRASA